MAFPIGKMPIQSTAGAITVRNEKGELTMEKVKVQRYVTGKRPDYAAEYSSEEEEGIDLPIGQQKSVSLPSTKTDAEKEDRRLRRLQDRHKEEESDSEDDDNDRLARHRRYHEPQVIAEGSSDEEEETAPHLEPLDESSEEEELDEDEIEQRRAMLRQKARAQQQEELLDVEEENVEEGSGEESSEYEEYTDSEEEEIEPRLRPVFVRKKDRATMLEREREAQKQRQAEIEAKHALEERRRQTIRMVHQTVRQDIEDERKAMTAQQGSNHEFENMGCTDDENDEEEYEAWKVRELKRIKRDREEREQREREKQEIERLHNMTEEERRLELKNNPKLVTNKANKGKYKFLQKYYHRGAFFLDEEDEVFKRDVTAPTLEDHFDKTVQPKVMQVKNFGRSGRTKYTHLVDQDTTHFDSPWLDTAMSLKFHSTRAGGMKQGFEKPTAKRTNTTAM